VNARVAVIGMAAGLVGAAAAAWWLAAGRLPHPALLAAPAEPTSASGFTDVLPGVYFGWTAATGVRLQLLGHPCPAPDAARTLDLGLPPDAPAGGYTGALPAWLAAPTATTLLVQANADLGVPLEVGVMLLTGDTPGPAAATGENLTFSTVTFQCLSGASGRAAVGAGELQSLATLATSSSSLRAWVPAANISAPLAGRLILQNAGGAEVLLESVAYAPADMATGHVEAAAGGRAQLLVWSAILDARGRVAEQPSRAAATTGSEAATLTAPTPWDAGYQPANDERRLRVRSSASLGLRIAPGEVALIHFNQRSLRRTLLPRPAVLYPVVTYLEAGSRHALGVDAPLVGLTGGWLGRPQRRPRSGGRLSRARISLCRVVARQRLRSV